MIVRAAVTCWVMGVLMLMSVSAPQPAWALKNCRSVARADAVYAVTAERVLYARVEHP